MGLQIGCVKLENANFIFRVNFILSFVLLFP